MGLSLVWLNVTGYGARSPGLYSPWRNGPFALNGNLYVLGAGYSKATDGILEITTVTT